MNAGREPERRDISTADAIGGLMVAVLALSIGFAFAFGLIP